MNKSLTLQTTSSEEKILFYTGIPNYDTLLMCFCACRVKRLETYDTFTHLRPIYSKPGNKRELSAWQEFTMVLLRETRFFNKRYSRELICV